MITIQGLTGKSEIMLEKMKSDLEKHDIFVLDTLGIFTFQKLHMAENKYDMFFSTSHDFDLYNLDYLERTLKEALNSRLANNIKRIYLSMNVPANFVTKLHLMEQNLGVEIVVTVQMDHESVLVSNYPILSTEKSKKLFDLKKITNKQRVKAVYIPDLAFNKSLALIYDKETNQFIPEDNSFGFDLEHIVFDEGFEVYLIEYKENFEYDEWNWDNPTVDQEINPSKVTKLNKKEVVQFVELEEKYA